MKRKKDKYALYCRVSTREQTTDNQRRLLLEKAELEAWDYEFFEEVESSRKTRPVKNELLQRTRNKEFSHVVVLKLDRWARSVKELTDNISEFEDRGIKFVSLRDNIDLSTATGKLQYHIISAFAEFERDLIRERTLDGLERAKAAGKKLGRPHGAKDKGTRSNAGYLLRKYDSKKAVTSRRNKARFDERQKEKELNKQRSDN